MGVASTTRQPSKASHTFQQESDLIGAVAWNMTTQNRPVPRSFASQACGRKGHTHLDNVGQPVERKLAACIACVCKTGQTRVNVLVGPPKGGAEYFADSPEALAEVRLSSMAWGVRRKLFGPPRTVP